MAVIDQTALGSEQDYDPAPGVDIVMPMPEGTSSRVLDGRTLKLIGALHRRFWGRRREMLQRRAQMGQTGAASSTDATDSFLADLTCDGAASWESRISMLDTVTQFVDGEPIDSDRLVGVRGWEDTEPGVLVDGRAVPGSIFDLAVAMSVGADAFRREQNPFSIATPVPADDEEAQLWLDLGQLAHDRAGIDRGTVQISPR